MIERSYLERHENFGILVSIEVADTFTGHNGSEPENIVGTQSKHIGQEGVTATQKPPGDSYQRVATNDAYRVISQIGVDVLPDDTRPNIKSLFYVVICDVVESFHRNEDALFGWIYLGNGDVSTALDLWYYPSGKYEI